MPTGRPAIVSPRTVERDIAIAINNIRERIENIEAELTVISSRATSALDSASGGGSALSALMADMASLRRRVTSLEAGAPVSVYIEGDLIGTRRIVDLRAPAGADVSLHGELTEDRVIVYVTTGFVKMSLTPATIRIYGSNVTMV